MTNAGSLGAQFLWTFLFKLWDLWAKPLMFSAQFGTESPAASHVATPISVLHTFSEVLVG